MKGLHLQQFHRYSIVYCCIRHSGISLEPNRILSGTNGSYQRGVISAVTSTTFTVSYYDLTTAASDPFWFWHSNVNLLWLWISRKVLRECPVRLNRKILSIPINQLTLKITIQLPVLTWLQIGWVEVETDQGLGFVVYEIAVWNTSAFWRLPWNLNGRSSTLIVSSAALSYLSPSTNSVLGSTAATTAAVQRIVLWSAKQRQCVVRRQPYCAFRIGIQLFSVWTSKETFKKTWFFKQIIRFRCWWYAGRTKLLWSRWHHGACSTMMKQWHSISDLLSKEVMTSTNQTGNIWTTLQCVVVSLRWCKWHFDSCGITNVYDQVMGETVTRPYLHVRYRASQTEDRRYKSWVTGSAGGVATNDTDEMKVSFLLWTLLMRIGSKQLLHLPKLNNVGTV